MADESLRLYGPNAEWRNYVSGTVIQNYALASSIWSSAKLARDRLGIEQKAPTNITKLDMPIWGSDLIAIANFVRSTVAYNSKPKTILQFRTKICAQTIGLKVLDYVFFAFGPYGTIPVGALILEKAPMLSNGEFEITLMTIPKEENRRIATELGNKIITETGNEIIAEV